MPEEAAAAAAAAAGNGSGSAGDGEAAAAAAAASAATGSWLDDLPDDLKGDQSLTQFKSKEDLARSYIATKGLVGRKRAMPADNASESEWESYYADIGRPAEAGGYELAPPAEFPKELYSEELEQNYRTLAHQVGLTPKQAKVIYDGYLKANQEMIAGMVAAETAAKAKVNQELKQEWGDQYDEKLANANLVIQAVGGKDTIVAKSLADKDPIWNHPALARFLAAIGEQMRESEFVRGGGGGGKPALTEEARTLMSSEAYLKRDHADHQRTVSRVKEIYSILHPDTGVEE